MNGDVVDDGGYNPLKPFFCPFKQRGFCRLTEEQCPFTHDTNESYQIPDDVCSFHLLGQCHFGDTCMKEHRSIDEVNMTYGMSCLGLESTNEQPGEESYPPIKESGDEVAKSELKATSKLNPKISEFVSKCDETPQLDAVVTPCSTSSSIATKKKAVLVPFTSSSSPPSSSTAIAPEVKSFADVCSKNLPQLTEDEKVMAIFKSQPLCPYGKESFECPDPNCPYLHGQLCDLCSRLALHPYNEEERKKHTDECVTDHEKQMELSFAIQRSMNMSCGICLDIVMEKEDHSKRSFGILESCNHTYCLDCIRQWRQTKQIETKTVRSCPQCRVSSHFIIPSKYWFEDKADKDKLIEDYKKNLSLKPCKHFNQGRGKCPFRDACFYRHANPDGTIAVLGQPKHRRIRNSNNELIDDYTLDEIQFLLHSVIERDGLADLNAFMSYLMDDFD